MYMQFNEISDVLIVAAQFFWSQSHGKKFEIDLPILHNFQLKI